MEEILEVIEEHSFKKGCTTNILNGTENDMLDKDNYQLSFLSLKLIQWDFEQKKILEHLI